MEPKIPSTSQLTDYWSEESILKYQETIKKLDELLLRMLPATLDSLTKAEIKSMAARLGKKHSPDSPTMLLIKARL